MLQLLYNINIEKQKKRNKEYYYNLKLAPRHIHINNLLDFDVVIAPPTGPECINTAGFEYAFLNEYKQFKTKNTHSSSSPSQSPSQTTFICGSYGAYRTTALLASILSNKDNITNFYDHIIDMTYTKQSTPESLETMMVELRDKVATTNDIKQIIHSKDLKIAIIVARLKPVYQYLHKYIQYVIMFFLGLTSVYFPNILQSALFDRLCFHTNAPPTEIFPVNYVDEYHSLTIYNYKQVLKASSCIPGITVETNYIKGCGKGIYMDGGISDTHIGFRLNNNVSGVLLNRTKHLNQNIFHKILKYPNIPNSYYHNLSLIYPTKHCKKNTLDNHLPTFNDWFKEEYVKNPNQRKANWRKTKDLSITHLYTDIKDQFKKVSSIF